MFEDITNKLTSNINSNSTKINFIPKQFTEAILKAAKETNPRGSRKIDKPYRTPELDILESEVSRGREVVENEPTILNNTK